MERAATGFACLVASSHTTAEVAAMLGRTEGHVRQRIRDRTLYALPGSSDSLRGRRLPAFQFEGGEEVPGIGVVLEALDPELHPIEVLNWFTSPNADLYLDDDESEGRPASPKEWLLAGGDPEALVPLVPARLRPPQTAKGLRGPAGKQVTGDEVKSRC